MPSAKATAPPPSAMGKTGSLKSRFSFGRSASISLSKASIFSFKSVPAQQPVAPPPPEPVPVAVRVPPARPSEDTVVAIERKPSIVLDSPQTSPVLRTPSSLGRASTRSRVSFDAPFVQRTSPSPSPHARPSLDLAHLRPRHSPSPSPSPLRQSPSFLRASPNSSAFDLSSLQFSRDEIPVPVGDSSADVSHATTGGGDGSFNIDELDPDLALLLQPGGGGAGAAVTSTPARPRKLGVPPVSSQHFFDTSPSPSPSPGPDSFSAPGRPRGGSLSTRTRQLQAAHTIARPGTAPPAEDAHAQRNFFARRLGIKRSTSVEDVVLPTPSRAGRASLDYGASPREPPSSSRFGRGSLDYGSPAYTPARPSLDRGESPRPSIDTVRASRRAALERSTNERTNLFTTSLRARRGELGSSHSERAAGSEYGWERDERTWRPGEFGEREARSEYGGARSEFTGSGSGGARSEYSGARSEFGGARSASEYAGPTAAWRRASPLSPSPTPTATRSVTSGTSSSTAYLSDELERLRAKHAAETEALLAALGDAQRSARVLREENERLRGRVRELEERERERSEEARRAAAAVSRERKPALVPRRGGSVGGVGVGRGGHARVASGATTVRASPSPSPSPSPSLSARPPVVRARTSPIPRIVHPTIESSFDGDVSLSLDLDDADALDAQIRVPKTPHRGRHVQSASDASASSFALSLPPEGQSLLRDALPESDAEPEGRSFIARSPSHAILQDSFDDDDDDEILLDGLEASPTLVLGGGRARGGKVAAVQQPREVSMTETEMSGSPTSARSLKLRPEHERLLGMGFESEVDV